MTVTALNASTAFCKYQPTQPLTKLFGWLSFVSPRKTVRSTPDESLFLSTVEDILALG